MQAELETDEVLSAGDAADDPGIWISPNDLNQRLIAATDERAGLCSFDLERRVVQLIIAGGTSDFGAWIGAPRSASFSMTVDL